MYGASGIFESRSIRTNQLKKTIFSQLAEQRRKVKQHIQKTFPRIADYGSGSLINW